MNQINQLTPRELDTILAALRRWRARNAPSQDQRYHDGLEQVAREHGPSLDAEEIDSLCTRLTMPQPAPVGPVAAVLRQAERFIAGFEDDDSQRGVKRLLGQVRGMMAQLPKYRRLEFTPGRMLSAREFCGPGMQLPGFTLAHGVRICLTGGGAPIATLEQLNEFGEAITAAMGGKFTALSSGKGGS